MHYCFQIALRHISVKGRGKEKAAAATACNGKKANWLEENSNSLS